MKIALLGAGRVGNAIARDLALTEGWQVTVADMSQEALDRLISVPGIQTVKADLTDRSQLVRVVGGCDVVVGAVPGPMGFSTLEAVIRAGTHIVDISFFEQDPFDLDLLAKEHGVVAVMDCGVAPGCSNLILGHCEATFDEVEKFSCWVGGLPVVRHWPYEYRSVFSPIDVIAEYTRPARLVINGQVVLREALSEIELLDFAGVGTLEAFNTDGLRTLLKTCGARHMKEKTVRYPGHAAMMRMLRETGFFDHREVAVGEAAIRPVDLTSRLLADAWRLGVGEEDLTVMRVEVEGRVGGVPVRHIWNLLDRFDPVTATTAMARTTGYTCCAAVHVLAEGLYDRPGLVPPELLGRDARCYGTMMAYLERRGVVFDHTVEEAGSRERC